MERKRFRIASQHSGAAEAGTLRLARLAGITACGAFKNSLGCEQKLRTCHGACDAVDNQAHRIAVRDTIAVAIIKIVVVKREGRVQWQHTTVLIHHKPQGVEIGNRACRGIDIPWVASPHRKRERPELSRCC